MSDPRDVRRELRGAIFSKDDATLVAILGERPWPEHALQLIGDGLGGALARHADGAEGPARDCVAALRERGWRGDDELAEALESRLGNGPARLLRPLPVDLESLATALEGDPGQGNGAIDRPPARCGRGSAGRTSSPRKTWTSTTPTGGCWCPAKVRGVARSAGPGTS